MEEVSTLRAKGEELSAQIAELEDRDDVEEEEEEADVEPEEEESDVEESEEEHVGIKRAGTYCSSPTLVPAASESPLRSPLPLKTLNVHVRKSPRRRRSSRRNHRKGRKLKRKSPRAKIGMRTVTVPAMMPQVPLTAAPAQTVRISGSNSDTSMKSLSTRQATGNHKRKSRKTL